MIQYIPIITFYFNMAFRWNIDVDCWGKHKRSQYCCCDHWHLVQQGFQYQNWRLVGLLRL